MKINNARIRGHNHRGFNPAVLMLTFLSFMFAGAARAQDLTNLFFLHHSVGDALVVAGNMRGTINAYNASHGTHYAFWDHGYNYAGLRNPAGEATGTNYDIPNDNTDPDGLHDLWTSSGAEYVACRTTILNNHQVIAFKSCYPASHVSDESALNTYKNYYLAMRAVFDLYPGKLFVVMSPPPLHRLATNDTEGYYARAFANWLKSAEYLSGHANVVCFDLFGYLAGSDNFLKYEYEDSHSGDDSHPNTTANQTVGPIFAQFLIASAAAYQPASTNLTAPSTVSASHGTYTNKVRVSWSSVSGATGYQVWRHTANDSSSAGLLTTTTGTTYDDTSATTPNLTLYYWLKAQNNSQTSAFSQVASGYCGTGSSSNLITTGDIDGDRLADLITVVGSNWYVWFSSAQYLVRGGPYNLGISGIPTTGDIDGDQVADIISVTGTSWYVWFSSAQYLVRGGPYIFNVSGTPVTGDVDGDQRADIIIVSGTSWYVWFSSAQYLVRGGPYIFNVSGTPVTGDVDGDGLADIIVVADTSWYVWLSTGQYLTRSNPYVLDAIGTPATGDIDGDRLADFIAVTGSDWYVWFSSAQYAVRGGPYTMGVP